MDIWKHLPSDIINLVLVYDGSIRQRAGRYMNQIAKTDPRYPLIQGVPPRIIHPWGDDRPGIFFIYIYMPFSSKHCHRYYMEITHGFYTPSNDGYGMDIPAIDITGRVTGRKSWVIHEGVRYSFITHYQSWWSYLWDQIEACTRTVLETLKIIHTRFVS